MDALNRSLSLRDQSLSLSREELRMDIVRKVARLQEEAVNKRKEGRG